MQSVRLNACWIFFFFFFNDTATTEIYTLSLHDALPIFATVAQALVTRIGVRAVLAGGMTLAVGASILYANMPVHGSYFANVLPGMVIGGIGLVCGFVTATIASVSGVGPADAGVASGLIN